eukprot:CAMPEP_0194356116 /NCGR_PEP_ID=MMETSP0174-20130528/3885_1 /TAXON_ID=216777 /ORGANISM="Proboscia alata, Strain PI-D3" /LENGTH=569 /DNA_ID=CAMNT_0039125625 /DNA_START=378 /DNA_END=2087 /DNA_ORIENTATION=-
MAESSIPGAGVGIFTSLDIKEGDLIGEAEILIPIMGWIDGHDDWLVHDVQWDTSLDGRLNYDSKDAPSIFYPGFGAQINCHMGLNNVWHKLPKYDSINLHRRSDPGVGAFTPWHDIPNVAKRRIQAGEELFVNYGEHWFKRREKLLGPIPFSEDYESADATMEDCMQSYQHATWKHLSDEVRNESWINVVADIKHEKIRMALPKSYEDLKEAHGVGSARYSLYGKNSLRTQEWFDENAFCMDNLYMQASKIPQAGRGVFVKHFIATGSIISPFPVLQLNKDLFVIHDTNNGSTSNYQLLTNYAFAHPDSNVVLLPYNALVNGINHDGVNPNAEIRWSESNLNRKDYLGMNGEGVLKQGFGLLMELVALRDLQPDEEVLISYGDEWEEAWTKHVTSWKATQDSDEYVSAVEMMHRNDGIVLTESEQQHHPYPSNMATVCNFWHREDTEYYVNVEERDENGEEITIYRTVWTERNNDCMRYCKVLSRSEQLKRPYYNVELIYQEKNLHEDCLHPPHERVYVDMIPQHAVTLTDRIFTGDIHLINAFRHFIGLPSHLLPEGWKHVEKENNVS